MEWNKFFGKADLDFGRFKPMWYNLEIEVPVIINGIGRGSVTTNAQPFLLTRITHAVVGCTYDWQTTGLYQDGQYSIWFRDEINNYQNQPIMAETMFGCNRTGHYLDFAIPIGYPGNRTISFEITNRCARTLSPESDYFTVALTLHGVADWGPKQSTARTGMA